MTVAEEPAAVPQAQAEEPAGKETGERADQEKAQAEPDSQESSPKPDEQPDPMDYSSDYLGVLGNNIGGNVGSAVANYGFLAVHTGSTGTPPAPVVNGPIPDRLSKEAAGAFATPGGFAEAGRTLRDHHMVLLCGTGTGRSVAGVRLLIDRNARSIHRLDVEKPLAALTFDALSSGHGYLWDGMAPGWERRLDDRALQGLSALLECAGSWLVLAVDEAQLPAEGRPWAVALKAPDPREVYRRQLCLRTDSDGTEVNRAFVEQLAPDATPRQAAAAARLQVRVSREGYQPEQALHELSRRTGQEVADWFAGAQPVAARALMIAIAVFEHRPYAEVRQAAFALERRMHDPDLRWIWRYWPPNLFADARDGRLDQVRAEVRTSSADDHDVVRFVRPGWGAEVLDCVWRQYERLRPVLRDWLEAFCLETSSYGADAHRRAAEVLGNLVGRERDPDPVGDFESWAESPKSILREMAAAALGRIAEAQQPRNAGLVRHRLNDWSAPGSPVAKRLTAALAYGRAFGVTQPRYALRQLGSLTKRSDAHLRDVIIQGVLALVREPANRPEVLEELVEWTSPTNAWTRRQVGLASALWVLGLAGGSKADNRVYRVGITDDERTRTLTRALLRNLMDDRRLRPKITSGLLDWAACAEREPALVPGFRSLLHAALAPPDDQVSRRISFDIRRLLYDEPETVGPLCTSVDEVLGRFAQ